MIINIEKAHLKNDKRISYALMAPPVILTIQYFILIYFNLLETGNAIQVQFLSKILVGFVFAYALPIVLKKNLLKVLGLYFFFIFIFTIHYLIFTKNRVYIHALLFPFFFMSLPAFMYSLSIHDLNVLKQTMKKASYLLFILGVFLAGLVILGKVSIGTYSMSLSYYMLLPAIMFIDEFLDEFSLKSFLLSLISLLVILTIGSRGAILCIVVFFILKLVKTNAKLSYKKILGNLSLLFIALFVYILFNEILKIIYDFLLTFGIRSRSISLFLNNPIHLSGRDSLYKNVLEHILESPLLGLGIGGDRVVLEGAYAHNLFIELMADFGIIGSAVIIGLLSFLIIKAFFTRDMLKYNIVIIWFSLGFVNLMVSASYLTELNFWIFLGILLSRKNCSPKFSVSTREK